ncbi:MAG: hypothetical protein ACLPKW_28070 [Acetobacteraceae bacterium]
MLPGAKASGAIAPGACRDSLWLREPGRKEIDVQKAAGALLKVKEGVFCTNLRDAR